MKFLIKHQWLSVYIYPNGFWFRIFGRGLNISWITPMFLMFSERHGYTKYWRIGRVKINILKEKH